MDEPVQLAAAVQALALPDGLGHAWAGDETQAIAEVCRALVGHHGLSKERVRASAYWEQGQADHHESLDG